jgi:CRISPR-associated protein Cas1
MNQVLYVTTPGALVHQVSGRLRVIKGKELLQEVRLHELERVVILGGTAGMTSQAATCLMEAGVETAFLSSTGRFRGWLSPAKGRGVSLRLAQFDAYSDPVRRLSLARAIVAQKIRNSETLLARYSRNHDDFDPSVERERLARSATTASEALSVASLLGIEGDAAAAYFAAFGRMLKGGFSFSTRTRRPPRDAANALLSFGYTLLSAEATSAVAGAGLDPALGMLHEPQEGRPSLGLDLTEEFRQPLVDRLVLALANTRVLSATEDFTGNEFRLTDPARRRFLLAYEERMTERFFDRTLNQETSLRGRLRLQAHRLGKAIQEEHPYVPYVLR